MNDLSAFLNEQMNNPEFAQEYNAVQPEMDAIRSMIKARKSQNLTQKQLAELVGIDQGDISKLENGLRNPTIQLLKRIADSMNMTLLNLSLSSRTIRKRYNDGTTSFVVI